MPFFTPCSDSHFEHMATKISMSYLRYLGNRFASVNYYGNESHYITYCEDLTTLQEPADTSCRRSFMAKLLAKLFACFKKCMYMMCLYQKLNSKEINTSAATTSFLKNDP